MFLSDGEVIQLILAIGAQVLFWLSIFAYIIYKFIKSSRNDAGLNQILASGGTTPQHKTSDTIAEIIGFGLLACVVGWIGITSNAMLVMSVSILMFLLLLFRVVHILQRHRLK